MSIYEKMLKASEELGVVAKNLEVSTGLNKSYKAVSERDIIDAVKPIEALFGIYSFPLSREIIESDLLETVKTYKGEDTKTVYKFIRLKVVYRFVDVEDKDSYIDITSYGDGIDTGDKAPGKAMTYADKYALMKAYKISTGDDPDAFSSEANGYKKATMKQIDKFQLGYTPEERFMIRDHYSKEYNRKIDTDDKLPTHIVKRYIEDRSDVILTKEKEREENVKGYDLSAPPQEFY